MATVRLRQPTDMGNLPTSNTAGGGEYSNAGTWGAHMQSYSFDALGTFDNSGPGVEGTISEIIFDNNDFGSFPNIDITGLSFSFSEEYYDLIIFNFLKLLGDVLAESDQLTGSSGNDTLLGFDGNDTLVGGGGDNLFDGGNGMDTVSYAGAPAGLFAGLEDWSANTGEAAGDTYAFVENLIGSSFNDIFYGTDANNRFTGGSGNDLMIGKGGEDIFNGGSGLDTVAYDASFPYSGNLAIQADLMSPGINTGDAAGDAYISIENLEGSSFDDILFGSNGANVLRGNHYSGPSGADQLFGRGGNDLLEGKDQADTLSGGSGDDRLDGGRGNDKLTGGPGSDRFTFNTALNATSNVDRIEDFSSNDFIQLDRDIFTGIGNTLDASEFRLGASAADANDRIIYNPATATLFFDADGVGGAAQVRFATFDAGLVLSNADFLIM